MPQTEEGLKKAEKVASEEGGTKTFHLTQPYPSFALSDTPTGSTAPAPAMRDQTHSSDKMENELEMQKGHKEGADSAEEVAGRKDKGAMTGLLEKVTGDPKKGDPNK